MAVGVSMSLTDFLDDNSQLPGGDGTLDPQLSTIVVAVIGTGSDVNFRTDYWAFEPWGLRAELGHRRLRSGLPSGAAEPNGEPLGFYTFQGDGSIAISTTGTPPAAPPAAGTPNNVLKMEVAVTSFAGYIHAFGNTDMDTWVTQDWSTSEGISFWMYGLRSGTQMFIDILDNRNPGSTKDDAERFTATFADDFEGWKRLEFPFGNFVRKEVGNGAPNDGLGLFEMHGYAIGTLGTGGAKSFYFDDVSRYGRRRATCRWLSTSPSRSRPSRRGRPGTSGSAQPCDGAGRPGRGEHQLRHGAFERGPGPGLRADLGHADVRERRRDRVRPSRSRPSTTPSSPATSRSSSA